VHKPRVLDRGDRATRFGVPATSPARTVIDYAVTAGDDALEWAIAEACGTRMLRLIRGAKLPVPEVNQRVAGYTADFLWPEQRLIVELDSYPFHSPRAAFERDHRRDIVHKEAGYEVLRFTGRQLDDEPLLVLAAIVRALDRLGRTRG
jgi:very-short-patch-repair endonuclease